MARREDLLLDEEVEEVEVGDEGLESFGEDIIFTSFSSLYVEKFTV